MKKHKKYILGAVFVCLMTTALAFWSFSKIKKENNANYTGAAVNTGTLIGSSIGSSTPSITVISPNGGEVLQAGKSYTIKWKTKGIPSAPTLKNKFTFTVFDSTKNVRRNMTVSRIETNNGNEYVGQWIVPTPLNVGEKYFFGIEVGCDSLGKNCIAVDTSDNPFLITPNITP